MNGIWMGYERDMNGKNPTWFHDIPSYKFTPAMFDDTGGRPWMTAQWDSLAVPQEIRAPLGPINPAYGFGEISVPQNSDTFTMKNWYPFINCVVCNRQHQWWINTDYYSCIVILLAHTTVGPKIYKISINPSTHIRWWWNAKHPYAKKTSTTDHVFSCIQQLVNHVLQSIFWLQASKHVLQQHMKIDLLTHVITMLL